MTTMSPSKETITNGEIAKINDLIAARLRKSGLPNTEVQQVIESQGDAIAQEFVESFRKRVEAISDMIVRHATVDRSLSPDKMLDATDRAKYTDKKVVKGMPKGEGEETDVYFFKVGRYVSDEDLEKEYTLRGLIPADPYSQGAANRDDKVFADEHPNGTHWKDSDGNWCFASFRRWDDGRGVHVYRHGDDWYGSWWFAGLRK